jgi:hypothetical protein
MEPDYFRRDQKNGISPPDLTKESTYAEHIVHTRGKRTRYTTVSLDLSRIKDFGEADYRLERPLVLADGHSLIEHDALVRSLRKTASESEKGDRLRAVAALKYAMRRKEGIVDWSFEISGIARKDVITWAKVQVQQYFTRLN